MTVSEFKARQVREKSNEVVEYNNDGEKVGRPLPLLISGGAIALVTLALIFVVGYLTWGEAKFDEDTGAFLIVLLAPFYVGGVFIFSYGYELYNLKRALRLTAIIVFLTVAIIVIVVVIIAVIGALAKDSSGGGSSRSSEKSSSKSSSSKSSGGNGLSSLLDSSSVRATSSKGAVEGALLGGIAGGTKTSSSSKSAGGISASVGDIIIPNFGGGGTRVETREVTKEVVKEVPKEPMPITCPFCSRSYVPVAQNYVCPNCGAATPKDLIEKSQLP
ncbi:MAG: hypothetical protein LC099_10425 [Anaerolineales bacterium]|nr:hypothetical protein [Anaerolineales bacterium]